MGRLGRSLHVILTYCFISTLVYTKLGIRVTDTSRIRTFQNCLYHCHFDFILVRTAVPVLSCLHDVTKIIRPMPQILNLDFVISRPKDKSIYRNTSRRN